MGYRRIFAILVAIALSVSLLPSSAWAIVSDDPSVADLINSTRENAWKVEMSSILSDWNASSFSSKSPTEAVTVWSGAGGAKGSHAFVKYAFYKLYGHSDSIPDTSYDQYIVSSASDFLTELKSYAAPGDKIWIARWIDSSTAITYNHAYILEDIDASGKISVFESGYASTNTARHYTYSSAAALLKASAAAFTVNSNGSIDTYSVALRIFHPSKNDHTAKNLTCNKSTSSSSNTDNTGSTGNSGSSGTATSNTGSQSSTAVTKYGKVHDTDGNLAINSKPAAGNMIGKIPEGGVCTVYPEKASGSWYWVSYNGVEGYSYGKYITLGDTKPAAGTTSTGSSSSTATSTAKVVHGTVHDTAGNLAINQQPKSTSNGATMLGKIPEGKVCVVYTDKTKNGWYWVEYQGVQGYAYNKYVKLGSNHTLSHVSAKQPTCTAAGNREYWTCSGCGQCYTDSSGNNYVSQGSLKISATGHTMSHVDAVSPSCTTQGNSEYWYCAVCGKFFGDSSGNSTISQGSVILSALGHIFQDGTCTRCGVTDPGYTPPAPVEPEPVVELDPVVEPTDDYGVHFPRVNTYRSGQFTDVAGGEWYASNVKEAYVLGLMKGNSATTFRPTGTVTLAEAITMAARIHSIYQTGSENFRQESGGQWYMVYLDYALDNGIISRSIYRSDVTQKATRSQFAEIFANALPDQGLYGINTVSEGAIPDVSYSGDAGKSVYKLYRAGILTGSDAQRNFKPNSTITRAECAAIVSRMAESNNRVAFTLR